MQFVSNKTLILGLSIFSSVLSFAFNPVHYAFCDSQFRNQPKAALEKIYSTDPATVPKTLNERIQYFSQLFLDKPYALTALGEGRHGKYDQAPLYRFDAFDCQTFVETVLSLALSDSAPKFKQCMQTIRYAAGNVDYLNRHHFTSPDWNGANQQQGILQDITTKILDQSQNSNVRYAEAIIHKANWYQQFKIDKIRLCSGSESDAASTLRHLQKLGKFLPAKVSKIPYLPIQALISKDKNSQYLLDQIPSGAIIEIIRPNWDLSAAIGTHLNVSHIGFAIRDQGKLYFYQSSSVMNKVIKSPLEDYLISMLAHPTVQGINVQIALPTNRCR